MNTTGAQAVHVTAGPAGAERPRPWATIAAAAVIAALGVLAVLPLTPRSPAAADAPAATFSAGRAYVHVTRFAGVPHPTGSAAAARTRDYIAGELRRLGLSPAVRSATTATAPSFGTSLAGRVTDVSAIVPGRPGGGSVLLVAHYDSAPNAPGASDDGIGVATILEVARALTAGPRPRNTVVLLFTDGEEAGLLGAHAYLSSGAAPPPDRSVVLNLEARGTSGPALMFETGGGDRRLVSALRGDPPVTTSFAAEVYRRLPNDTDFTEFRRAGFSGMNFAIVGGAVRYHTPEDSVANVSRASLQDMGTVVLGATRRLAAADLTADRTANAVYFTAFGTLVSYPRGAALPLALVGLAGYLAALWYARRHRALRLRATAVLAGSVLLPIAVAAAVGWAGWLALRTVRPDYAVLFAGTPYRGGPAAAGLSLFAVASGAAWAFIARRRRSTAEIVAAVVGWLTVFSLLTAVLVAGAHYLFTVPALAGAGGIVLAAHPRWQPIGVAALGVPAVVLLVPIAVLLFSVLGLAVAMVPLILIVLVTVTVAPLAGRPPRPRAVVALVSLAAVIVVAIGTAVTDRPDVRHPAQTDLVYAVDADARTARWASASADTAWTRQYVPDGPVRLENGFPMLLAGGYRTGDAPVTAVPTPRVTRVDVRTDGAVREFRLRVAVEPGTSTSLALYVDTTSHTVEAARLDDVALAGGQNRPYADSPWKWGAEFAAPDDGVDLTLRIRGAGPIPLRLVAQSAGIPPTLLNQPRPADVTWSAVDSGMTLAARTQRLG